MTLKKFLLEWPSKKASLQTEDSMWRINNPLREFLCNVLDDAETEEATRKLALKAFLRVGSSLENPLHLVMCAINALKHGIDISKDLEQFCLMPEVYPFEQGDDNA